MCATSFTQKHKNLQTFLTGYVEMQKKYYYFKCIVLHYFEFWSVKCFNNLWPFHKITSMFSKRFLIFIKYNDHIDCVSNECVAISFEYSSQFHKLTGQTLLHQLLKKKSVLVTLLLNCSLFCTYQLILLNTRKVRLLRCHDSRI